MLENDVFHHVAYDHTFKDEYLFYRFPVRNKRKKNEKKTKILHFLVTGR